MISRGGAIGFCLAAALGAAIVACGKDSSSASPSATPTPTATPMPALTITVTSTGASPKTLTVAAGSQVTFVNNDSIDHQMYSDPHPALTPTVQKLSTAWDILLRRAGEPPRPKTSIRSAPAAFTITSISTTTP